ncbi:DUF1461 domain-containing protein [Nesterenkonia sp. MY13]|uniref:DUF1461 domain-containing protein n=1 Tax=Nesterenkonia sedimenti TaxID=1463632 RepID=A0A7X8YCU1_9MICC|nr:DUF1461 domain-containing protein [Nesterenkonia sedimenti]NLS08934.1 DUF1461 domain-containing protein [Nesterenkonia sedimenti]
MSQNPDESRETNAEEKDFESGLDYGAFASEEPDFPEERLGEDTPETEQAESPAEEDEPTQVVPPVAGTGAARPAQSPAATSPVAASPARSPEEDEPQHTTALGGAAAAAAVQREQQTTTLEREEPRQEREPREPYRAAPHVGGPPQRPADVAPNDELTEQDIAEEAAKSKRGISRFFTVLVAIFTPLMFIVLAIRLVGSPLFLYVTYARPGFPADPDGWGLSERLLYGSYGTDFLFNLSDSRYLSQLAPGGEALFTENEVSHMIDVKVLIWYAMAVGVGLLVLTLLLGLMLRAWRPGGLARGIFAGAWATIALVIALAALAIWDWQFFFEEFHHLFFPQGNWAFDGGNLIRLYPGQFWVDAGIWLAGFLILFSLIALLMTWPTKRRRELRAERLEEVQARKRAKLEEQARAI